ncbi:MAG TPA: CHC2 zinc finger domain-containing protein, partial [Cyanophyceae cyanobacterium]
MFVKQSKLIHSDIIEAIKQQADLVNIVERHITLKRRGKDYIGLCPFHEERTPSFTVSPSKQFYHCFGCGVGGDAIHFLMQLNQNSFQDVVLELARDYSIQVRYEDGSFEDSTPSRIHPSTPIRKRRPEPNYLPASIPDGEIELATLPTPVTTPQRQRLPHAAKPNVDTWVTRFLYSDDQWVDRIEWIDTTKPK